MCLFVGCIFVKLVFYLFNWFFFMFLVLEDESVVEEKDEIKFIYEKRVL